MSTQLEDIRIEVFQGYEARQLQPAPDVVVVGNVMTRGVPVIEALLASGIPYTSGPEWLASNVLRGRWVLAMAGTHGKTSTTSMLAWILECAGHEPGFLVGGIPPNFGVSARLGRAPFFVIEADEYDTAFFDKRAKFVHYRPRTALINNLEFDHADIYPDVQSIPRRRRSPPSRASSAAWKKSARNGASSSTTTSLTIRARSPRRSTACAAASARHASSPSSNRAPIP